MAGAVALGAALDAVSNAVGLSNWEVGALAILLAMVWAGAEVWLRLRAPSWRLPSGQSVQVRALGIKPRLAVAGALLLLGASRVSVVRKPVDAKPTVNILSPLAPTSPPAPDPAPSPRRTMPRPPNASPLPVRQRITDLLLESRLTCTLNTATELPPGEVDFWPVGGGSDARLRGPAGDEVLRFSTPVRFREHAGSLTVINRFALAAGSELHGRPDAALAGFTEVQVPIVTVVYGTACSRMRLLEVAVRLNGEDLWYQQWPYDVPFQQGPTFTVPLAGLHARLNNRE